MIITILLKINDDNNNEDEDTIIIKSPTILRAAHMRKRWETTTSVSAGHIILTPTQPVGRVGIEPGKSSPGAARTAPPSTQYRHK